MDSLGFNETGDSGATALTGALKVNHAELENTGLSNHQGSTQNYNVAKCKSSSAFGSCVMLGLRMQLPD